MESIFAAIEETKRLLANTQRSLDESGLDARIAVLEQTVDKYRAKAFSEFCKACNVTDLDIFERDNLEEAQKFVSKKHSITSLILKISEQLRC